MKTEYAYSLCEAMEFYLNQRPAIAPAVTKMYLGSYFCDRYYCTTSAATWCGCFEAAARHGLDVVLVIPTPSQQRLAQVKAQTEQLLEQYGGQICEIVVNDQGMLAWVADRWPDRGIWLGRTMDKELRDPRYPLPGGHGKLLGQVESGLYSLENLVGVETDVPHIDPQLLPSSGRQMGIHTPYAYLTMGRICELASIGLPPEEKFQLYRPCRRQCMTHWLWYDQGRLSFLKYGRAVYTPVSQDVSLPADANVRLIESVLAARVAQADSVRKGVAT